MKIKNSFPDNIINNAANFLKNYSDDTELSKQYQWPLETQQRDGQILTHLVVNNI